MLGNILAAAWRHLARNRLHAAISLLGLAIGFSAVLLAGLFARNQFTRDHFIPGHERIFLVATSVTPPGRATVHMASASTFVGAQLALRVSGVEAVSRSMPQQVRLTRGELSAMEQAYWADANFFELLPLPVVAGDLRVALARPATVVLSRSLARKYFGRDTPLGETLLLEGGEPFTVTAIVEDLPPGRSHLRDGAFLSTLSARSPLQQMDRNPANVPGSPVGFGTTTYLRLAPGMSATSLQQAMQAMAGELFSRPPEGWQVVLRPLRMDQLSTDPGLNPVARNRLAMMVIVALGVLAIAGTNFINLLATGLARRAPEVAVRKLAGASRGALAWQFLGEVTAYVAGAMLLAVALTELLLPHANVWLSGGMAFDYWQHPRLLLLVLAATLLFAVLAGGWPALRLSGLAPLSAFRGGASGGRNVARQVLVTLQFAILIGLMIAAGVVHRQQRFATGEALRFDTDQLLLVRAPCAEAFVNEVARLPGVRGLACGAGLLGDFSIGTEKSREGIEQLVFYAPVQPALFGLYGIQPLVGRLSGDPAGTYYVLNETAARRLGHADPSAALGVTLSAGGPPERRTVSEVIGVVRDFSLTSVREKVEAMAYRVTPRDTAFNVISVKLTGAQVPETLAAIDALWKQTGARDPISRQFADEYIQGLYTAMLREARLFTGFSVLALLLACMGLLGLAAAITARRTREIGIRKALGARTADVARLLLWEFAQPVLWANLIAWPVAAWLMQRWLQGYAYHADLPLWLFPAAGLLALLIALLAVTAQLLRVSGAKPVTALRHQ